MNKNKHIIILGAGESGVGAALLAAQQGCDVFVSDNKIIKPDYKKELKEAGISFEENHSFDKINRADEIVKSPGIPEKSELMLVVRAAGIPVISEIELAYRYCKNSKIIAITGTNGKTTTTALTGEMFKKAGINTAVVGNIGVSFARQVAVAPADYYVVEVSSFQLDDICDFHPDVAVLLNITADHLDRYDYKIENYAASKFRIAANQTADDYFIYCKDDELTNKYIADKPIKSKKIPFSIMESLQEGGFLANEEMHIQLEDDFSVPLFELALKGRHNIYNSMAASISSRTMGIRKSAIRACLTSFKGLPHRMAFVAAVKGVMYINDSKATNINSVWFSLESMEAPVVLILGGVDKGNDYGIIKELVREKVKAIICIGKDNARIHEALAEDVQVIVDASSMKDAVYAAYMLSGKGDVVLLSPACASFDLFNNYEDRGTQFVEAVRNL